MRGIIKSYPEVVTVISQHGRPDDGTDATGFFNAEFFVPLKPFDTWPRGIDKEKLTDEVNEALGGGISRASSSISRRYIEDNVEEAASGVKGENSVKLFGNDLDALEKTADKIKEVMSTVPGIADLAVFNSLGQPTVQIEIDRARAARYGLAPGDINSTVQAAIGGQAAGNLYEEGSDRNFPIIVRLAPRIPPEPRRHPAHHDRRAEPQRQRRRADPAHRRRECEPGVRRLLHLSRGSGTLHSDQVQRARPRPWQRRARGAAARSRSRCSCPAGYRLEWVGEFGELQEAIARLAVVVPLSLLSSACCCS